jgi:hypothetical protein
MKWKFTLGVWIGFGISLVNAQSHQITLETSEQSTKKGGIFTSYDVKIFDEDASNIYGLSFKPGFGSNNQLINIYDKTTYNLISEAPFFGKGFMGLKTYKILSFEINQLNGRPFGTFELLNKKAKTKTLYGQYMKEGAFDGDPIEFVTVPYQAGFFTMDRSYTEVNTFSDADVFYIKTGSYDKKTKLTTTSNLFYNDKFELLEEKQVELPYEADKIKGYYRSMDEHGNLYFLVELLEKEITKNNKKEKLTPEDLSYNFVVFNRDEKEPTTFSFQLAYFISSCKFRVKDNIIYCAGFWGKKGEYEISGSFSCKYDATTGQEISTDLNEFDDQFVEEFYTEKQVNKAEKKGKDLEVPHIVFHDILINSDGSYYLVGEYSYQYQVCHTDSKGNTYCYWVYVHNDIITLKVNTDGEIEWTKKIPRRSSSRSSVLVEYAYKHVGDEVLYMYYDNKDNFSIDNPREIEYLNFGKGKEVELVGATINADGEVTKQSIYDMKVTDYELTLYPGLMKAFGNAFYCIGIEEVGKISTKRKVLVKISID